MPGRIDVETPIRLLIADRNPHVRDFLRRELAAEGYVIVLARSCQEILEYVARTDALDLLILDPDLTSQTDPEILRKIRSVSPDIPVVIHSFLPESRELADLSPNVTFVEKQGNSIDQLKQTIYRLVRPLDGHG
jgi:DNA-binding NtrC family response regulator